MIPSNLIEHSSTTFNELYFKLSEIAPTVDVFPQPVMMTSESIGTSLVTIWIDFIDSLNFKGSSSSSRAMSYLKFPYSSCGIDFDTLHLSSQSDSEFVPAQIVRFCKLQNKKIDYLSLRRCSTHDERPATQWAAVNIHDSDKMLPPHLKPPLYNNATWCGNWFVEAKSPPTILALLSRFTAEQQEQNVISNPIVDFILNWETRTCKLVHFILSFYSNKLKKLWSGTVLWHELFVNVWFPIDSLLDLKAKVNLASEMLAALKTYCLTIRILKFQSLVTDKSVHFVVYFIRNNEIDDNRLKKVSFKKSVLHE